jgi:ATP-dependent DNA helicase RecG
MNLKQLTALINKGESSSLEFKKSTGLLRDIFETICAFLNGNGGTVLIGVTDAGKIIGQDVSDHTKREIAHEISKLEPSAQLSIKISYVSVDKKQVIVIKALPGKHVPYTYDGRAFYRNQSTTSRMQQHLYEQLLTKRKQSNHEWEETIATGYKLEDLDQEEIYKTVADGIRENRIPASAQRDDVKKILKRLDLIDGNKLKLAAIVLYAKQDSIRLVQCMIKLARFNGEDKLGDFIDNQQIQGNAFKLLTEADAFFRRHLPIASFFKPDQFKRIDKPALPVLAIREALINAICHRDYAHRGTDISVAIFNGRVDIWNNGSLPSNMTVKDLSRAHESVLRNKLIANVFYVRGLIEKWGTGTNKMIALCKEAGLTKPEFSVRTGGLSVVFNFATPIIPGIQIKIDSGLTSRQREIISIIKKNKQANIQCIISTLENPPTKRMIQKDLFKLKALNIINCEGKSRATMWFMP